MESMCEDEPDAIKGILAEIIDKASGVFLWAVLACRSLLQGFAAYDYIQDLQKRIDELPPELEDLFRHMLGNTEPRYQSQGATLLRLCYYSQRNSEAFKVETLGLAVIDSGRIRPRSADYKTMSVEKRRSLCKVLEGRLRSRCCGLLEVRRQHYGNPCFCMTKGTHDHDSLIDSTVHFMHRTVFEFLEVPGNWDLDFLQIEDDFEPTAILALMSLHLTQLSMNRSTNRAAQTDEFLNNMFVHSIRADRTGNDAIASVFS
ncbi:hypothetical protein B0T14DRAFT_568415 [Immersiella caudata]|uniref:DUF7791 domain-containing protein n=1 Tax=Immersiella caudata TaxID=314043 RepID=A0AA39WK15_9PEZI|nr:hypothetical protein B0T14DRAFT_568415 [Immersiella caudata]